MRVLSLRFQTDIFRLHERQSSHSQKSNLVRLFDSQALDLILFRVYFPSRHFVSVQVLSRARLIPYQGTVV